MRFLPGPSTEELEPTLTAIPLDHYDGEMCKVIFASILATVQRYVKSRVVALELCSGLLGQSGSSSAWC